MSNGCTTVAATPTDIMEKNEQARMMGDIYARARLVLVWLGVGSANTKLFFKYAGRAISASPKRNEEKPQ
jgi:hypothetical protein